MSISSITAADVMLAPGAPLPAFDASGRSAVLAAIRTTFAAHGAVAMHSNAVGLSMTTPPEDAVRLLGVSGEKLALRYESRLPFCAWLAFQAEASALGRRRDGLGIEAMRRFEISRVHREARGQGGGGGLPRTFQQADLDIVSPWSAEPLDRCVPSD